MQVNVPHNMRNMSNAGIFTSKKITAHYARILQKNFKVASISEMTMEYEMNMWVDMEINILGKLKEKKK